MFTECGATYSDCGRYRYTLSRTWDDRPPLIFIMLNPSTADHQFDDSTIRRCIGFAHKFDCGGILVANLFAWRATDPSKLKAAANPVGPENDRYIAQTLATPGGIVIAAWGVHGQIYGRAAAVLADHPGTAWHHLGNLTKDGSPRHPLYLSGKVTAESFLP